MVHIIAPSPLAAVADQVWTPNPSRPSQGLFLGNLDLGSCKPRLSSEGGCRAETRGWGVGGRGQAVEKGE